MMRFRAIAFLLVGACVVLVGVLAAIAQAAPSSKPFEIIPGSFHITLAGDQAGAHADMTTAFDFAHETNGRTDNDARTTIVNLPAGFMGNNTAVPTCTGAQLINNIVDPRTEEPYGTQCPPASQVGTITLVINADSSTGPVRARYPSTTWKRPVLV